VRDRLDPATDEVDLALRADGVPLLLRLGKGDYRRGDAGWAGAGRPRALVRLAVAAGALHVAVEVRLGRAPHFAPPGADNDMDNERADVNSDGAQLYLRPAGGDAVAGWLVVPEPPGDRVRVTPLDALAPTIPLAADATARGAGWTLACRVPLPALAPAGAPRVIGLDLVVNETPADRERRRGQLVLSGAAGEFVYLRGDRHDADRLVRVRLPGAG
jgi:hypothetical protein